MKMAWVIAYDPRDRGSMCNGLQNWMMRHGSPFGAGGTEVAIWLPATSIRCLSVLPTHPDIILFQIPAASPVTHLFAQTMSALPAQYKE